jgi:hypothetical protein
VKLSGFLSDTTVDVHAKFHAKRFTFHCTMFDIGYAIVQVGLQIVHFYANCSLLTKQLFGRRAKGSTMVAKRSKKQYVKVYPSGTVLHLGFLSCQAGAVAARQAAVHTGPLALRICGPAPLQSRI